MSLSFSDGWTYLRAADLRKRNISLLFVALSVVAWLYLVWEFHKWDAKWGPINVLFIGPFAAGLTAWWISRRTWYRDHSNPTRWRFFIIPIAGFILCAVGGIYFTEPIESGGSVTRSGSAVVASTVNRRSPEYQYNYSFSRASDYYLFSSILDLGGSVDDVDVDEGCFVFILVLLVVALVLGSFMIPHFWIVATFVLMVIMAMVARREWRYGVTSKGTGQL